jgi:hypothetical protein
VGAAHAAAGPEEKCQADRAKAAGKYTNCAQKAMAKLYATSYDFGPHNVAAGKCVTKYAATWPKLQAKAAYAVTTCANARFDTSVAGTVIDRLTGLQWEKKTDDATIHDKDDLYSWSTGADGDYTDADGTAFTTFLAFLNSGGCFAGQCDWRLPTRDELLTIVTPACTSAPCIDSVFGPTVGSSYWSATSLANSALSSTSTAWAVYFHGVYVDMIVKSDGYYVRAVRAGL